MPYSKGFAAHTICRAVGLGLITAKTSDYSKKIVPWLEVWPEFRRHARTKALLASLSPEQENQAPGTSGSYWTPFKDLVRNLTAAIK